ncbi:MAG: hypothetical protein JNN01_08180 [Opitutaceae bacterium]|nr:hypothetical protein [Opitutaceae bacterium]
MNPSPPNDPLSPLLATWRVTPTVDPQFRTQVWSRIQSRARESWPAYVRSHLAPWSIAAALVMVSAGWVGHVAGKARLSARRDAMVVSYLVDLDPRVQAKLRP